MISTASRWCAGVLCIFAAPIAQAQVTASLLDSTGDPHAVSVVPGATFDVFVQLDTNINLSSGQFKLIETTSPVSGLFTLNSISAVNGWADPPLLDPSPVGVPGSWPAGPDGDMGTVATDPVTGVGSGPMLLLHLAINGTAAPGIYTLNLNDPIFGDTDFQPVATTLGIDYLVHVEVIPEPVSGTMAFLGFLTGLMRRRPSRPVCALRP